MPQSYIERILRARVYDVAQETPLDMAKGLSERLQNTVLLKREDLQSVFSFKLRGAYNKMVSLPEPQRQSGVIAASAGNHAQGVALAAERLGIKATIVMPRTTPDIKVNSVRQRGASAILHGDSYDEAYLHAVQLAEQQNLTFIHPYDDPDVIAGQGTIGMEILRQVPGPLDAVFVPVGGGGLIAGVAAYIKFVRPEVSIIGVEPTDADCLYRAMNAGRRVKLKQVGLFADGVAVRQIGKEPFRVAKKLVDEVVCVNTDEICAAIKDIFDDTRSIAEPAGALALAGLKHYVTEHGITGQHLVAIESGANVNFDRLRHVAERAEVGEQREALFAVTIPEQPGSFLRFCKMLGNRSITEFNYRFHRQSEAHIFVGLKIAGGHEEREKLVEQLLGAGYQTTDLTANELAKEHIRYMVGGHCDGLSNEVTYSFEFPERPGALLNFLSSLGSRWNISMFHYRNHGAAYGRVFLGAQVPTKEHKAFNRVLDDLGYSYSEENNNPAYSLFAGTRE